MDFTPETALNYLRDISATIKNKPLRDVVFKALGVEGLDRWPASHHKHHAYEGGLVIHTAEVLLTALVLHAAYPKADLDVLVAATVWHDLYKMRDYAPCDISEENPNGYRYDQFSKLIHHINGGAIGFTSEAFKKKVPDALVEAVVHCILAHHGRPEWGSPVVPQTLEASILNCADGLSAYYGEGAKRNEPTLWDKQKEVANVQ